MKKYAFIFMTAILMLAITGCDFDDDDGNFWARDLTKKTPTYYKVNAEKLAENSLCEVWAERGSGVTVTTANTIADEYINNIYPKMMKTFGFQINDPDLGPVNTMQFAHYIITDKISGGKLTILLLDIKDGYNAKSNPAYTAGYFTPFNFFEDKNSNSREMIYMDTNPANPTSPESLETLAHEMQHLMNFVTSVAFRYKNKTLSLMETWVDEGLASAAQWVYSGKYSDGRLKHYNSGGSGLIAKGNNFYIWDNHDKESNVAILDDYATVYLFFQYLRLQSSNNDAIYHDIITSQYPDYRAVTTANSINSAHKNKWETLLRDWFAANVLKNSTGEYGYKGEINTTARYFPSTGTTVSLYPGEGVYSNATNNYSVPSSSGNISYAGLTSSGTVVTTGSTNGVLLTYNINTNSNKDTATSAIGTTTGASSVQITDSKQFTGSFQVDAGYFLKNRNGLSDEIRSVFNGNSGRSIGKSDNFLNFDRSKIERVFIDE